QRLRRPAVGGGDRERGRRHLQSARVRTAHQHQLAGGQQRDPLRDQHHQRQHRRPSLRLQQRQSLVGLGVAGLRRARGRLHRRHPRLSRHRLGRRRGHRHARRRLRHQEQRPRQHQRLFDRLRQHRQLLRGRREPDLPLQRRRRHLDEQHERPRLDAVVGDVRLAERRALRHRDRHGLEIRRSRCDLVAGGAGAADAADRATPTTLYASTTPNNGVLKYTTASNMWTASNSGLPGTSVSVIASAPGGKLWAGVDYNGLYSSTDSAGTWSKAFSFPNTVSFDALATDFSSGAYLYVGDSGGVHVTVDGGTSWSNPLKGATAAAIAVDPSLATTVYVVASNGVYQSTDGAANFHPVFLGFNALYGTSFGVLATNANTLLAGSQISGIARSTTQGQ